MKIEPNSTVNFTVKTTAKSVEPKQKSNEPSRGPRTATKSSDKIAQKINRWFAPIGLSSNAEYVDYNAKSVAARRHQDIRKVKRIENLNTIMSLATNVAVADVSEENIDPDWFYAFIDLAENIYTPEMQEVWGKILAVEVSRPGSFSLRSLETLRKLTQRDALLFAKACKLASRKSGDTVPQIISHYHQRKTLSTLFFNTKSKPINLGHFGLSYPSLLTLIDLGLIMPSEIESAELPLDQSIQFKCGESKLDIEAKKHGVVLVYYKFSTVGSELFLLSRRQENKDYVNALVQALSMVFKIKVS
ncbi:TIGR03899 family protein [Alteromonas sp. 5E99-2]|uniref:TIGR03899 family protein n=1 Tax=Alteromonas sp. 5E99-2 TaxID=2817683 RepID=UPI001A9980A6|nr:TIGR03899 family protein [Alteromonas sp. 5E99-2]MBO1254478.1 TIGR03899 family protein [Alteromonas sp. 5E99-2]